MEAPNLSSFSLILFGWRKASKNRKPFLVYSLFAIVFIIAVAGFITYQRDWLLSLLVNKEENQSVFITCIRFIIVFLICSLLVPSLIKAYMLGLTSASLVTIQDGKVSGKDFLKGLKSLPLYMVTTWIVRAPIYGSIILYVLVAGFFLENARQEQIYDPMGKISFVGMVVLIILGLFLGGFSLFWGFRYHFLRFVCVDPNAPKGIFRSIRKTRLFVQGMAKPIIVYYFIRSLLGGFFISIPYLMGKSIASWVDHPEWMRKNWFYLIWVFLSCGLVLWIWPSQVLSQARLYEILEKRIASSDRINRIKKNEHQKIFPV